VFIFLAVPLAISFLPGSRVAVVTAHQPVQLPRKRLTEPWDTPNAALCSYSYVQSAYTVPLHVLLLYCD